MSDPIETAELIAFVTVVDSGSISRAALELGLPRATVGRRLERLEERLSVRLIHRTTRSLTITDAGRAFHRRAENVLRALDEAAHSVLEPDGPLTGTVRVSVLPGILETFGDLVVAFGKLHPAVRVEVHVTSRAVDLRRDGFDLAVRASTRLDPGLIARPIAEARAVAVASPAYLDEMGTPKRLKDLQAHRCLLGFARGELPDTHWPLRGGRAIHVTGVFATNDIRLLRVAARGGRGIALLPEAFVADDLASGTLVRLLPGLIDAPMKAAIVYPDRQLLRPAVREFIEEMMRWKLL